MLGVGQGRQQDAGEDLRGQGASWKRRVSSLSYNPHNPHKGVSLDLVSGSQEESWAVGTQALGEGISYQAVGRSEGWH